MSSKIWSPSTRKLPVFAKCDISGRFNHIELEMQMQIPSKIITVSQVARYPHSKYLQPEKSFPFIYLEIILHSFKIQLVFPPLLIFPGSHHGSLSSPLSPIERIGYFFYFPSTITKL